MSDGHFPQRIDHGLGGRRVLAGAALPPVQPRRRRRDAASAVAVAVVAAVRVVVALLGVRDVRVGPVVVGVLVVLQEHRGVEQDLADGTAAGKREVFLKLRPFRGRTRRHQFICRVLCV